MSRAGERQQAQLEFIKSGQEIEVGHHDNCPLAPSELANTDENSPYVVESFTQGLTAHVFKLSLNDRFWTLKVKRPESLVKNIDGQTSFLTEVQRRADFTRLKQTPEDQSRFQHIVDTQYASLNQGIILSPWIEGKTANTFDEKLLRQIFSTLSNMELAGLFEWDLCPGNIISDDQKITLFDFGYNWPFDPLTEFNSNGITDPLFHSVERFETRNYFAFLLQQESDNGLGAALNLYEMEKKIALEIYLEHYEQLSLHNASNRVLRWREKIISGWDSALTNQSLLENLFIKEAFRSHVLDVHDDLTGKSCTPFTLKRADKVISLLEEHYELLDFQDGLFFGDEAMSKKELLKKYHRQRALAETYLL